VLHTQEATPASLPHLPASVGDLPRLVRLQMTADDGNSAGPDCILFPALPGSLARLTALEQLVWGNLRLLRAGCAGTANSQREYA
jgi:hypothetical protein